MRFAHQGAFWVVFNVSLDNFDLCLRWGRSMLRARKHPGFRMLGIALVLDQDPHLIASLDIA